MEKIFSSWSHMGRKSKSVDYFLSDFVEEEITFLFKIGFWCLELVAPPAKMSAIETGE